MGDRNKIKTQAPQARGSMVTMGSILKKKGFLSRGNLWQLMREMYKEIKHIVCKKGKKAAEMKEKLTD